MKASIDAVVNAIAVAADTTQTPMSATTITVLARDLLQNYPVDNILRALERCRRELQHQMMPAHIEGFLQEMDGRPVPDVAWSLAVQMLDEAATVVTNDEITEALALARPIYAIGDKVGARKTFIEAYAERTRQARQNRAPGPRWYPTLGTDADKREYAIRQGLERGQLTAEVAQHYLPKQISAEDKKRGQLLLAAVTGQPANGQAANGQAEDVPIDDPKFMANIERLRKVLRERART